MHQIIGREKGSSAGSPFQNRMQKVAFELFCRRNFLGRQKRLTPLSVIECLSPSGRNKGGTASFRPFWDGSSFFVYQMIMISLGGLKTQIVEINLMGWKDKCQSDKARISYPMPLMKRRGYWVGSTPYENLTIGESFAVGLIQTRKL